MPAWPIYPKLKRNDLTYPCCLPARNPPNAAKAVETPALFVDKNSPSLISEVRSFSSDQLCSGNSFFALPDGREIARASNTRSFERLLHEIPDDSFVHHASRNDLSRSLSRTEIMLASKVRPIREDDFSTVDKHRQYLHFDHPGPAQSSQKAWMVKL